MDTSSSTTAENLQADVVVVGAGGAGLCAAVSAAESGVKKVVVLEKARLPGGNTRQTVCVFGLDSPTQKRMGIHVDRDEHFRAHMNYGHWKSDPRLVRTWFNKSGEVIGWLQDKGAKLDRLALPDKPTTHQTSEPPGDEPPGPGGYNQLGRSIVRVLQQRCDDLGVEIRCEAPVTKIITDDRGAVSGVVAAGKQGEIRVAAKSAIIASGGFANNKELLAKYFPRHKDAYTHSLPQMTGDGLSLARDAGAHIDEENMVVELFGPHYNPYSIGISLIGWSGKVLWVNENGERFVDESISVTRQANERGHSLGRQPNNAAFVLLDTATKNEFLNQNSLSNEELIWLGNEGWTHKFEADLEAGINAGRIKVSDSLGEIAQWMGADAATLFDTVKQYNSFCDDGYDADFAKDKSYLKPLRQAPFIAIRTRQGIDTTHGGVKINSRMEACDTRGSAIGGLYATGDIVEGVESDAYDFLTMAGNSLSWALVSGFIAGESAAEYIAKTS